MGVKNVHGDETFTKDGNSLVWQAKGNDIYYQGETEKELPIECKVRYELNGEDISSKELAGKSGNVKIIIEYINKASHKVAIKGKAQTLYTPFVVVCGTILDNTMHKNITVNSGKVIDDGSKTIVMGMAFPGLRESLGVSKNEIDIPNTIEITMDSKEFELGNIASFVTPKVIEDSDLEIFDELDKVYSKINTLENSSKQLVEGANTLKQGTDTYYENYKLFNNGVKNLAKGTSKVKNGYSQLDGGIKELAKNTPLLEQGAKQLSDGTKKFDESLEPTLTAFSGGLTSLEGGFNKLENGINSISKELDAVLSSGVLRDNSAKVNELKQLIEYNKKAKVGLEKINTSLTEQIKQETDEVIIKGIKEQIGANTLAINVLDKDIKANTETIKTLELTDKSTLETLQTKLTTLSGVVKRNERWNSSFIRRSYKTTRR